MTDWSFYVQVLWAEQQALQPYRLYSFITFNDPGWKDLWYFVSPYAKK